MDACNISILVVLLIFVSFMISYLSCSSTTDEELETEDFNFEPSPYKKCLGEIYEINPQSAVSKECSEPTMRAVVQDMSCPKCMKQGLSHLFQYTPISNANWENTRCNPKSDCAISKCEGGIGSCADFL